MDIKDLSVRLGHENVATTMNLYQHIPVDMARESAPERGRLHPRLALG